MRYERRSERVLTRRAFAVRLIRHFGFGAAIVLGSLAFGVAGYMYFEGLPALDAFLNAAMLLGGMGPVDDPVRPMGKLFAGLYALYAGLVFLVVAGILIAPVAHRVLHHFHAAADGPPKL
jgi:hypothetical protein